MMKFETNNMMLFYIWVHSVFLIPLSSLFFFKILISALSEMEQ